MKKLLILVASAVAFVSCTTMIVATGEVVERNLTMDGEVTALAISNGFDVIVDPTLPEGEMRIVTHTDIMDRLDIYTKDSTLYVGLKKSMSMRAKTLKLYIPNGEYETIAISGGADIEWHNCTTSSLTLAASGGADAEIKAACNDITVACSGGADIEITGVCIHLTAAVSGGADIEAINLIAEDVEVAASGGADISVYASRSIKVRASGGSDVAYAGEPEQRDLDASGGADIRHLR